MLSTCSKHPPPLFLPPSLHLSSFLPPSFFSPLLLPIIYIYIYIYIYISLTPSLPLHFSLTSSPSIFLPPSPFPLPHTFFPPAISPLFFSPCIVSQSYTA